MRQQSSILAFAALVIVSACGGDPTPPTKPNTRTMTARIDGSTWSAVSIEIDSTPPSILIVKGMSAGQLLALGIPLGPGVGTQDVGAPTPVFGTLGIGSQAWVASRTQGGAGSITLTTVAPGHVAGTFSFTLAAQPGATPASRQITAGAFDIVY